jgi:DNA-3-methyladenine glycosylase
MNHNLNIKRLSRNFFKNHAKHVAPSLLGKYLIVKSNNKEIITRIVETEAYGGKEDKASHAGRFGFTKRTAPLFGEVGYAYVYWVYINTYCLNIVAHKENSAGGVLIRALEPLSGLEVILKRLNKPKSNYDITRLLNGPGKLCRALGIDNYTNGKDLVEGENIYLAEGEEVKKEEIAVTTRINIPYAGISKDWRWRFIIKNSQFLSRR